ncbi:MAG: Gfo/Idh/MocA family protein [Planctomycetota bacterium]
MKKINRRHFIKNTTAAMAAFTIVPRHVLGGKGHTSPSDKLNIAGIGVGGMGAANMTNVSSENIIALCDVDDRHAARTFDAYPSARRYRDYREMLEKETELDAVVIATPDHTHAVITMAAIKAGKHVYCQKPLTHDVYEARMVTEAARTAGVITQMGIQRNSGEGIRLICEWIWDGAIGEIREVDAWSSLSYYPHGHAGWSSPLSDRPKQSMPIPETLNWDLWIGPAPYRGYHTCYHPSVWRCWWDFGCGMLGDRGCHTLDSVFKSLKLGHPESVDASTVGGNDQVHPIASIITYRFGARQDLPPVKLTWYDGLVPPRYPELEDGRMMGDREGGVLFKGSNGAIMCGTYAGNPRIVPESKMKAYQRPPQTIERIKVSHEMHWVNSCKAGKQPGASFDYSGPLTEMVLLGNVAKRIKGRLLWDTENMKITNVPEADNYIRTPYRQGWSL